MLRGDSIMGPIYQSVQVHRRVDVILDNLSCHRPEEIGLSLGCQDPQLGRTVIINQHHLLGAHDRAMQNTTDSQMAHGYFLVSNFPNARYRTLIILSEEHLMRRNEVCRDVRH